MSLSKRFHVYRDEQNLGKWISLEEFCKHLTQNLKPTDSTDRIRKFNMKQEATLINGFKEINDKESISVFAVIRCVCSHINKMEIQKIAGEVASDATCMKPPALTTLQLYKKIIECKLKGLDYFTHKINEIVEELSFPTLLEIHKNLFSSKEWAELCFFEHHFCLQNPDYEEYSADVLLEKKEKFFEELKRVKQAGRCWPFVAKTIIENRQYRKRCASEDNMMHFVANGIVHLLNKIELEIMKSVENQDMLSIVCVHTDYNTLEVFVEMKNNVVSENMMKMIGTLIAHTI